MSQSRIGLLVATIGYLLMSPVLSEKDLDYVTKSWMGPTEGEHTYFDSDFAPTICRADSKKHSF